MRRLGAALGLLTLLLGTVSPVQAQDADLASVEPVSVQPVAGRGEVVIDPLGTYLLIETRRAFVFNFVKLPSDEEQASWQAQRATALEEAHAEYLTDFARYESRNNSRSNRSRGRPVPIEPTEDNFAWPEIESQMIFSIGPQSPFLTTTRTSLYLTAVPPGDYIFYGTGRPGSNVCACMGSVRFHVSQGSITAVRLNGVRLDDEGNQAGRAQAGSTQTDLATRQGLKAEAITDAAYDPRLPAEMIVSAGLEPVASLPNWYGGTVNRILPIEGVLDYNRGQLVDLRERDEGDY